MHFTAVSTGPSCSANAMIGSDTLTMLTTMMHVITIKFYTQVSTYTNSIGLKINNFSPTISYLTPSCIACAFRSTKTAAPFVAIFNERAIRWATFYTIVPWIVR